MTDRMFGPPEQEATTLGKFLAHAEIIRIRAVRGAKEVARFTFEPFIYATMARFGSRRTITEPSAGGFHEKKGSGR